MSSPIRPYDSSMIKNDHRTTSFLHYAQHRSKYDVNSKIMLTAIISLSVVVLLVLALHIYARYILRRQSQRRRNSLSQISRALSVQPPPPKRGLDSSLIASLPLLPFSPVSSHSECSVCLTPLQVGEIVRLLPPCSHDFHVECIDTWLAAQSTCPVCRAAEDPTLVLVPEPREGPTAPVESDSGGSSLVGEKGSNRFSLSFRRLMLSRERSSTRVQPQLDQYFGEDLERQS